MLAWGTKIKNETCKNINLCKKMHEEDSVAEATLAPVDAQDNRTEACEIVKKEGNEHFKNGDYENALKSYENVLQHKINLQMIG